jgi:uncharacterized membrane protein
LRSKAGAFTQIDVPFAGATDTECNGINNLGEIVGGYFKVQNFGFYRSPSGFFTKIDPPSSTDSEANGINDSTVIVGNATYPLLSSGKIVRGYQRSTLGFFAIVDPLCSNTTDTCNEADEGSEVNGINNKGVMVGQFELENDHAFIAKP